ncbi:MAG: hypothetical protein ACKOHK_14770, partial [Planctomycetia bacterium]
MPQTIPAGPATPSRAAGTSSKVTALRLSDRMACMELSLLFKVTQAAPGAIAHLSYWPVEAVVPVPAEAFPS